MQKRAGIRSGDIKEAAARDPRESDRRSVEEIKRDIDRALGRSEQK
ncbi:MAG: hypothetical protein WC369_00180 [Dehalococcoidales bacterium]|nr:hypothetical protein [Syntrophorhabdaceae bacterium]